MAKWTKSTFINVLQSNCQAHVVNVVMDLIKYAESDADIVAWGRGEGYGTMTFKTQSDDWGIVPIFHITTDGQIKFLLNYLRSKIRKKEILRDYQLKLESNFMLDFADDVYTSDIYFQIDELFHTKTELDKFEHTVKNISDRLRQ